jgi:hypothetical protein
MNKLIPTLTLVAALAVAGPASAAKVTTFKGKTKEGTAITVTVDKKGWADIKTSLPTTCVSAQGGTPQASIWTFDPSYVFKVNRTAKVKDKSGYPTKNFTVTTRLRGKTLTGKLEQNFSLLSSDSWGNYRILTCLSTGSFKLRAKS